MLLGDYLFARAMRLVTSLGDIHVCQVLSDAVARMCEGELRQAGSRGDFELGEEEYMAIIADKTAALCECSCRLGAYWAGADDRLQDALARYGHHLGTAFQITDDVLDVNGNEAATGKSLGTDLIKQKATLPVIRLLQEIDGDRRAELLAILSQADGRAGMRSHRGWPGAKQSTTRSRLPANARCEPKRPLKKRQPAWPATPWPNGSISSSRGGIRDWDANNFRSSRLESASR